MLNPLFDLRDVDGFSVVGVNVPTSASGRNLVEATFTENGVYEPEEADGYSRVTVDVPETVPELEEITITENGVYKPTETDGYSQITVRVPQEITEGGEGSLASFKENVSHQTLTYVFDPYKAETKAILFDGKGSETFVDVGR